MDQTGGDGLSTIHQEDTNVITINDEEDEIEKRKRTYLDKNSSTCWYYLDMIEKVDNVEVKTWDIGEVFNEKRYDKTRSNHTETFKNALKRKDNEFFLKCKECKKEFPYYKSSKSCPLGLNHITDYHPDLLQEKIPISKGPYTSTISSDPSINQYHVYLASAFISGKIPLNFLNNEFLKLLFSSLQGEKAHYVSPSDDTMRRVIIPKLVDLVKADVKKDLQSVTSVCATVDGWTQNYSGRKYVSFTLHYFTGKCIKTRILRLCDTLPSHTAFQISQFINEVIDEYDLHRFVPFPVITDNASDVLKAVELSGLIKVGCLCHRIELAIKDTLNSCDVYNNLVKKCQHISVKFRKSSSLLKILRDVQLETYGSTLSVITDVDSRWFSTLYLMSRIIDIREELDGIIRAESLNFDSRFREAFIEEFCFSEGEKKMIKFFIETIDQLLEVSNIFSSEKIPSMTSAIPQIQILVSKLELKLSELKDDENDKFSLNEFTIFCEGGNYNSLIDFESDGFKPEHVLTYSVEGIVKETLQEKKRFLNCIINSIKKYFYQENSITKNETMIISAILDPRFKFDFFSNELFEEAKSIIKKIIDTKQSNEESIPGRIVRSENTDELSIYISERIEPLSSTFEDVLDYWTRNKNRFPQLYSLTHKYFSYLCSSCPSERLFSTASGFFSSRRTRMLPSHLEEDCILHSYITREGIDLFKEINFRDDN